jgi:hypothetical protein
MNVAINREKLREFILVCNALAEIRHKRLYSQDYDTFEEYCLAKWGITDPDPQGGTATQVQKKAKLVRMKLNSLVAGIDAFSKVLP